MNKKEFYAIVTILSAFLLPSSEVRTLSYLFFSKPLFTILEKTFWIFRNKLACLTLKKYFYSSAFIVFSTVIKLSIFDIFDIFI